MGPTLLFLLAMVCTLPSALLLIPFTFWFERRYSNTAKGAKPLFVLTLMLLCCVLGLIAGGVLSEYIAEHSWLGEHETYLQAYSRTGAAVMLPTYLTRGQFAGFALGLFLWMPLGALFTSKFDRTDMALRKRLLTARYRLAKGSSTPRRICPLGEFQWRELTPEELDGLRRFRITPREMESVPPTVTGKRRR